MKFYVKEFRVTVDFPYRWEKRVRSHKFGRLVNVTLDFRCKMKAFVYLNKLVLTTFF